jgi:hypothetical protein
MEEWRYSSTILDLDTGWKWMVSFMPLPPYPLDRRLDGPQSRSGLCGEEINLIPAGKLSPVVQPVARHYTDWAIPTLYQLTYGTSVWIQSPGWSQSKAAFIYCDIIDVGWIKHPRIIRVIEVLVTIIGSRTISFWCTHVGKIVGWFARNRPISSEQ